MTPTGAAIRLELAPGYVTPTTNGRDHTHRMVRRKERNRVAWLIREALGARRAVSPFERARVTIERHGPGRPDPDNLVGGCKDIIDCLLVPVTRQTKNGPVVRHAMGLGLVRDDGPDCIDLVVRQVPATRAASRMVILIEEMV